MPRPKTDPSDILSIDTPITALGLFPRISKALNQAGIETVRDLMETSDDEILNIRGIGPISLTEVKQKLLELDNHHALDPMTIVTVTILKKALEENADRIRIIPFSNRSVIQNSRNRGTWEDSMTLQPKPAQALIEKLKQFVGADPNERNVVQEGTCTLKYNGRIFSLNAQFNPARSGGVIELVFEKPSE